jgi:hypothetical protein
MRKARTQLIIFVVAINDLHDVFLPVSWQIINVIDVLNGHASCALCGIKPLLFDGRFIP